MVVIESDCVGCAIRCVRCGRHEEYMHLYCDCCDEQVNALWQVGSIQLCARCAEEQEIDTDDYEGVNDGKA